MTVLAQVSDPHLRAGDEAPAGRLAAVVDAILALDPPPDAVLLSGDVADTPLGEEYDAARRLLAPLPMPVHVLAGNHDDGAALRAAFGAPGGRYAARAGDLRLLVLDSARAGRPDGALGAEQLAWLGERLAEEPTPAIVAVHHAPVTVGVPVMDAIGLAPEDVDALAALLAGHPHVLRVVGGHVHRAVVSTLGAVPVVACPSTNSQVVLDPSAEALDDLVLEHGPPSYALHRLAGGELTTHVVSVAGA